MNDLRIGDQTIRFDRAATLAIYAIIDKGFPEECDCVSCKNFVSQRDVVYPPSFLALLDQLGIDPCKESEAFECGPFAEGTHVYGGWFHFVGEIVDLGEQNLQASDSPYFEYFFTTVGARPSAFHGRPSIALEFTTHVKWVLPDDPDSGRRRAATRPKPA